VESEHGGYHFVRTAAAWLDLLGYGGALKQIGYDLGCPDGYKLIDRAFTFQQTLYNQPRKSRIAIINDGVLISGDLEKPKDAYGAEHFFSDPVEFVKHIVHVHQRVNRAEHAASYPGARAVICLGTRVLRGEGVPNPQRKSLKNMSKNIDKGFPHDHEKAEADEAKLRRMIAEANDPTVVCTTHMQHSDAFARAYYAEQQGKKIGLEGPHVFVDSRLVQKPDALGSSLVATPLPKVDVLGQAIEFLKIEAAAQPQ
jgi:hypothetical protein